MAENFDLQQTGDQVQQYLNSVPEIGERTKDTTIININAMADSLAVFTLTSAIEALTAYEQANNVTYRKSGIVLSYKTDNNKWESKQFQGNVSDFDDETLWEDFGSGKVKTVSVNGGSAVQPDEHGNIDIEVPTDLKDLNDDDEHRTVTDAEKSAWSGKQPSGDYATRTELANGLGTLAEGLATKQNTISDLETIRSGAGKGATSVQGVKMEGDDDPLTPGVDGVVTIPQPEIPDSVTSVITNNELVLQTPDGQSVKGKVGITTGADGLLHLTLTDEEGNTYSSPIAGLRVDGNALQYSNDGETWVTVQTFGKLAIKYVQASDPASGDEGDLALVGSTNAYVLKVYVDGSWVSVGDIGSLDLTSDGITMAGENKTLTQKMAEVDGIILDIKKEVITQADLLESDMKSFFSSGYPRSYFVFDVRNASSFSLTVTPKSGSQYKYGIQGYSRDSFTTPLLYDSGWIADGTSLATKTVTDADVNNSPYIAVVSVKTSNDKRPTFAEFIANVDIVLTIDIDNGNIKKKVAELNEDIATIFEQIGTPEDLPTVPYDGEKITLRKLFKCEVWKPASTLPPTTTATAPSVQGGAIYGNYLFQFYSTLSKVVIYNLADGEIVQTIELTPVSTNHANSGGFSSVFYDNSDAFPLLYIAGGNDDNVYVYRITGNSPNFVFTLIQTITLDNSSCYLKSIGVDVEHNKFIVYGYTRNDWSISVNNNIVIMSCDIPDPSSATVTISSFDDLHTYPYIYAAQGGFVDGGYLYICYGNTINKGGIYVFDYKNGYIKSHVAIIDVKTVLGMGNFEPETIGLWNNNILMTTNMGHILRFVF